MSSRVTRAMALVLLSAAQRSLGVATAQEPPSPGAEDPRPPAPAVAQDFSAFLGTYEVDSLEATRRTIDDAILRGTETMPPVRRNVGRRRLHAVNKPFRVLRIFVESGHLVTEFDGDRYPAYLDGRPLRGRDPEGKPVVVSYHVAGDTLRGRYVGNDGEKRVDFRRGEGGRLTLEITLSSDQLPAPIRYRLPYTRR